jgi:hypothetical protein
MEKCTLIHPSSLNSTLTCSEFESVSAQTLPSNRQHPLHRAWLLAPMVDFTMVPSTPCSLTSAWHQLGSTSGIRQRIQNPEIYSNPLKQVWKPGVIIDLHCIVSSCPTFSVYFGFARGYKFRWTLVELRIQSARFTYTTESMGVFSSKPHGETHPMAACDKYATAWSSSLASHALQTPLHMFSGGGSGWWLSWVTCPRIPGKTESH